MTLRKIALATIIRVSDEKGTRFGRLYWSWYAPENEEELLYQLTKILEQDNETQNIERSYSDD